MPVSRVLVCLYVLVWVSARPAVADIDPAEYQLQSSVRTDQERKRLEANFALDKIKEAELQKQEEAQAAQRQAADKAAWVALPYPVRLTQTRCTSCHVAETYLSQRHNRVGWELLMLRMQYLNAAPLGPGQRSVIAAHLTEAYPATGVESFIEALQQFALLLSPLWIWLVWKVTRSHRRRRKT
jgi:hypothetical protein